MNVLNAVERFFGNVKYEAKKYSAFRLARNATIYVDISNSNCAKIRFTCLKYFPNHEILQKYISDNRIYVKNIPSHPDVIIDQTHINQVLSILKHGNPV
jgi:hypothetical protein